MTYEVMIEGKPHHLELKQRDGTWQCSLDGKTFEVDAIMARRDVLSLIIDGASYEVKREQTANDLHMWVKSVRFAAEVRDPRSLRSRRVGGTDAAGPAKILAPMPGKIVRILVHERDEVEAGAGILVVEAMKMQNELKAPKKGTVIKLFVREGSAVNGGDVLAIIE